MPDSRYPTIYNPLSANEWETKNAAFQQINEYSGLSLNEYGYVEGEIPLNENDSLTESFVIKRLEYIVKMYKSFLGISNSMSVDCRKDVRISVPLMVPVSSYPIDYYFEMMADFKKKDFWSEVKNEFAIQRYFLTQNSIENESFAGSTIYFIFNAEKNKITISGNWFPNVFIPEHEICSKDDALPVAYQFLFKETGKFFLEQEQSYSVEKTFVRKTNVKNVEIRECWKYEVTISDEDHNYLIYIDTQTSEVIYSSKHKIYYL